MGTWIPILRATSTTHSDPSTAASAMSALSTYLNTAATSDRAAAATERAAAAAERAAATTATGIENGENDTSAVSFSAIAAALMANTQSHLKAAHAHLVSVTAQITFSFSNTGRQPTSDELVIAECAQAGVRSSVASLAKIVAVHARSKTAHARLMVALSKEMVDEDCEILEYVAMDLLSPEFVEQELVIEEEAEIDECQAKY